jgi:hypothetical protein
MNFLRESESYHTEYLNGKKIEEEREIVQETPFKKEIKGEKNGKRYWMILDKKPKHVSFFIKRKPTPYPIRNTKRVSNKKKSKNQKKNITKYLKSKK